MSITRMRTSTNTKPKILLVVTQGGWGGAQRYVFEMAKYLNRGDFIAEVATGKDTAGELVDRLTQAGVKNYLLKNLRRSFNPLRNLFFVSELYGLLRSSAPDIVHFNSTNAGVFGSFAVALYNKSAAKKRESRIAVVYTAHGFPFNEQGLRGKIFLAAEKLAGKNRDLTICVSDSDRASAIRNKIAAPEKIVAVKNGIDPDELIFLPKGEAKKIFKSIPENALLIGTICQFYPTKGLRYFIRAAKLITSDLSEVFFAVVGGGPEEKFLTGEITRLGLQNKFFLLSYIQDGWKYLKAFDLIVMPSVKEGLPYFILEAALAERPIIASRVGGMPEVIEDEKNGLLIEPKNHLAIAEAVKRLILKPDLRESLGKAAAQTVLKNFHADKNLAVTVSLYRRLLRENNL